jgi:hypothetical protein
MFFLQKLLNLVALSMHILYFETKRILQVPQFDKKLSAFKCCNTLFCGISGTTAFSVVLA